jgi:hypothetical protein
VPSAKHAGRTSGLVSSVQSEASREVWRAVLAGDPQALSDHSPEWVDAICSGRRFEDAISYELHETPGSARPLALDAQLPNPAD